MGLLAIGMMAVECWIVRGIFNRRMVPSIGHANKSLDASRDSMFRMKSRCSGLTLPRRRVNSAVRRLRISFEGGLTMKSKFVLCLMIVLLLNAVVLAQSRRKGRSKTASTGARPTELDGKTHVESRIKGLGYILKSFKKTDGQSSEEFGVKQYKMEFEALVQCTEVNHPEGSVILVGGYSISCANVGDRHTLEGSIYFEKTEKGWRPLGPMRAPEDVRVRR